MTTHQLTPTSNNFTATFNLLLQIYDGMNMQLVLFVSHLWRCIFFHLHWHVYTSLTNILLCSSMLLSLLSLAMCICFQSSTLALKSLQLHMRFILESPVHSHLPESCQHTESHYAVSPPWLAAIALPLHPRPIGPGHALHASPSVFSSCFIHADGVMVMSRL